MTTQRPSPWPLRQCSPPPSTGSWRRRCWRRSLVGSRPRWLGPPRPPDCTWDSTSPVERVDGGLRPPRPSARHPPGACLREDPRGAHRARPGPATLIAPRALAGAFMAAVIPAAQSSPARLPTFTEAATWPSAAATVDGCTSTRARSAARKAAVNDPPPAPRSASPSSRVWKRACSPRATRSEQPRAPSPKRYREFAAGLRDGTNLVPDLAHVAARHRLADAIQRASDSGTAQPAR
jgi:hypothetical protein